MAIKGIIERIHRDTQTQIEKIKLEYQNRIAELERRTKIEEDKIIADAQNKAAIEKEKSYHRALEHGRFEIRNKLLAQKISLVEKELDIIKKKLENMDLQKQQDFFAKILVNLGQPNGEIVVGEDKAVFDESFLNKVKENFARENLGKVDFKIVHSNQKFRGIHVVQGKIRYDLSFDAIINLIRERFFDKVAKRLFEDK